MGERNDSLLSSGAVYYACSSWWTDADGIHRGARGGETASVRPVTQARLCLDVQTLRACRESVPL